MGAERQATAPLWVAAHGGWGLFAGGSGRGGVRMGAADASTKGLGTGGGGRRGRRARAQRQGGDSATGAFGWGLVALGAPEKKWRR